MKLDIETWVKDIRAGIKVACFGSRETPTEVKKLMHDLAQWMVLQGAELASGHADGADQAYELGALIRPEKFTVCLPWATYNKEVPVAKGMRVVVLAQLPQAQKLNLLGTAKQYHGAWERLSDGAKLLHGRNILIGEGASWGFTYLNHGRVGGGGSGQCYRYLQAHGVPVVDLAIPGNAVFWKETLEKLRG